VASLNGARQDVDGCHVGAGRPLNGEDVFSMFVRDVQGLLTSPAAGFRASVSTLS
jgi:hypothetical protein